MNTPESSVKTTGDPWPTGLLPTLIDATHDGVLAFDSQFRLQVINRQALHFLNLPGGPDSRRNCELTELVAELRLYAPEAVVPLRAELRRYGDGDITQGEGVIRTEYGIIHWLTVPMDIGSSTLSPSVPPGRLVILSDVTSQHIPRTDHQDLVQFVKDGLHKPLWRIAARMKHVVTRSADTLSEVSQQALLAALDEADSMLVAIGQLVDLHRLQSGQMPLRMRAFSFNDIMDQVLESEHPLAQQKAVKLEDHTAGVLPLAWGDSSLIERMFEGLVAGVIDVARPGRTIYIEGAVVLCDHSKIVISMTEGPVTQAGHAAEMGAMLLKASPPPYPHSISARDLNFAFCRKIAEAHGERLWISSSRTGGLLAAFSLPQVSASLVSVGSR